MNYTWLMFIKIEFKNMQMVEYCEGSGCRRKKILENFSEKVVFTIDTFGSCVI